MIQLEVEIWIQNMENHFGSNLISRKYEVAHALQYFTQSAAIWWKMHHAIQGFSGAETWDEFKKTLLRSCLIQKCYDNPMNKPCAYKIYGEIGHSQEEHKDGCPHCEEKHPAEECPTSQVTCFLCEGSTHYLVQCHIYPKVQQVVKQQNEVMKETLKNKILEEHVMKENIEDPDGQGLTRYFSNACYSCGEEGHLSQDRMKESQECVGNFPTEKVEFDPHEIEELSRTKKSRKKRKYTQTSQISANKDLSHMPCFKCKTLGHYANMCLARKQETKEQQQTPRSLETEAPLVANDVAFIEEAMLDAIDEDDDDPLQYLNISASDDGGLMAQQYEYSGFQHDELVPELPENESPPKAPRKTIRKVTVDPADLRALAYVRRSTTLSSDEPVKKAGVKRARKGIVRVVGRPTYMYEDPEEAVEEEVPDEIPSRKMRKCCLLVENMITILLASKGKHRGRLAPSWKPVPDSISVAEGRQCHLATLRIVQEGKQVSIVNARARVADLLGLVNSSNTSQVLEHGDLELLS
ncbi:hypothetical protein D1007_23611 [Hordeum vulgare]|nr:hypothetical protein D1007_23611 [Hordeum vulgare]